MNNFTLWSIVSLSLCYYWLNWSIVSDEVFGFFVLSALVTTDEKADYDDNCQEVSGSSRRIKTSSISTSIVIIGINIPSVGFLCSLSSGCFLSYLLISDFLSFNFSPSSSLTLIGRIGGILCRFWQVGLILLLSRPSSIRCIVSFVLRCCSIS